MFKDLNESQGSVAGILNASPKGTKAPAFGKSNEIHPSDLKQVLAIFCISGG